MENKNIIIILIVIIAILAIALGVVFLEMNKEEPKLAIKDKTIDVGDSLVVVLKDSHGDPIANQTINIKLTDKSGTIINEDITTNSKGKAQFKMEEKGKYSVECKFNGNNQYASTSISDKIKVEKPTTEVVSQEQTSTSTSSDSDYSSYGPAVDSHGVTREEAKAKDMKYIPQRIDGQDAGVYVPYDPKAGCYHT